jgi:hypothetical protein
MKVLNLITSEFVPSSLTNNMKEQHIDDQIY